MSPAQHPLVTRVLEAQREGLRPNAERFFAFLGDGPIELQILGGKKKWEENKFAHPRDTAEAIKLLEVAEKDEPAGTYVVLNEPDSAVTARAERGRWHPQKKGEATVDADIVARRVLFIDVDWERSTGTSTTDEQCLAALDVAARIHDRIAKVVPEDSIAFVHSGNCGAVLVALDRIAETPAVADLIKESLHCLHLVYSDARFQADKRVRNVVGVDVSVCDAKRLASACGTTKRKGSAGVAERPHRRTAFVGGTGILRLAESDLVALVAELRSDLNDEQREKLDRDMGRAPRKPASSTRRATPATSTRSYAGPDPFLRANQVPVADVLSWLGLLDGDQPICPGCREQDGSSVAIVGNGLKCLHNRCSGVGVKPGFRSVVDIVVDARKLDPIEAVRELAARFGFEVPAAHQQRPPVVREGLAEPPPRDPDEPPPSDDDAPDAPPSEARADVEEPASQEDTPAKPKPKAKATAEKAENGEKKTGPAPLTPRVAKAGPWTSQLTLDQYGKPKKTYGNLCIVLRNAYGTRLSFDEMRATPCLDDKPLGDADVGRIREELERTFLLEMNAGNVIDGVRQISEERRFHPVRAYLQGLEWDAKVRLPTIASRVLGTDDALHARMIVAWFVQAAKRALEPGCQADAALVLVGPQGNFKSTFFAILAGTFFSDTRMDISSRDGLMQLASSWIYEWSELENVTSRKQASEVKAFVTSKSDTFRPPFGKAIITHPRSSVVVGSTNEDQFLTDPTGSRRFWIVPAANRLTPEALAYLREHRDQLWAEAVVNAQSGYEAFLTLEEEKRREELAEVHQVADAFEDAIGAWLSGRQAKEREMAHGWLTTADVLEHALQIEPSRWDRQIQIRVGHTMKRLGWEHVRRRLADGRAVWAYLRPKGPLQRTLGSAMPEAAAGRSEELPSWA
ncbi:MAG: hypothetical protein HOV80_16550 [Polyangiaceae bacterium]|nr:hypothetical protein [Polyangiaceae bacterium]